MTTRGVSEKFSQRISDGFIQLYGAAATDGFYLIKFRGPYVQRAIGFGSSYPPRIKGWQAWSFEAGYWRQCAEHERSANYGSGWFDTFRGLPVLAMSDDLYESWEGKKPKPGVYLVHKKLLRGAMVTKIPKIRGGRLSKAETIFTRDPNGKWTLEA